MKLYQYFTIILPYHNKYIFMYIENKAISVFLILKYTNVIEIRAILGTSNLPQFLQI